LSWLAYSEAYAGLEYAPVSWLSLGLGAGLETGGGRMGISLWAGKGPLSVLVFYENGKTGSWYKTVVASSVTDWLSVGLYAKRFAGVGPILQVSVSSAKIWVVPVHDFEFDSSSVVLGIILDM